MGRETERMKTYIMLFKAAMNSANLVLMRKALDYMKELADKSGLESMKNEVENCGTALTNNMEMQMNMVSNAN